MTHKVNDNVAMMIITNVTTVKTFQTDNGFISFRFERCFYVEGVADNFPVCEVEVTFWKDEDVYDISIDSDSRKGGCGVCFFKKDLSAIEMIDLLGRMFVTDGLDFLKNNK